MKASELKSRQEYWVQVRECLIRFHNYSQKQADDEVLKLLERLPLQSTDPEVDFVYHVEPFRLACKVTGKRLSLKDYADAYGELLEETAFWSKSGVSGVKVSQLLISALSAYIEQNLERSSKYRGVRESRKGYVTSGKKSEAGPAAAVKGSKTPIKKSNSKKNKPVL